MNDRAQIHTIEGFAASALMVMTLMLVINSTSIIAPYADVEVELQQKAYDALTILDTAPTTAIEYNLTECVAMWNMSEATPNGGNHQILDSELSELLPDIMYNVDFAYVENGNITIKHVIIHGIPSDNSVVARRLVTLYNSTVEGAGGAWVIPQDGLLVVEVRLTAWKV